MNLNKTNDIVFWNGGFLLRYEKWFYGDTKLKVFELCHKKHAYFSVPIWDVGSTVFMIVSFCAVLFPKRCLG